MLETLIGAVTEAVFGYLLDQAGLGEKMRALLQRDPQKLAFKVVLTRTYATFDSQHPQWTESLFDEHFLAHRAAPLLARALLRDHPPTSTELAQAWADQVGTSEESRARIIARVEPVAADFLDIYTDELRVRNEFQPLFDSRAFDTTAEATTQTAQSTAAIEQELRALREELKQVLAQLVAAQKHGASQHGKYNISITHGTNIHIGDQPAAPAPPDPSADPPARTGSDPFIYGNPVPPEHFYGRAAQREHIKNRIGGNVAECVSIVGLRRSGKSSLLRYIRERIGEFCASDHLVIVSLDLQDGRFHTPEGMNEGLRRGIERATGTAPWQRSENDDPWSIYDGLEALRDDGHRLLVLIDEFERIGARLDQFENWGEDWRSKASAGLLTLVIATLRPLEEIYKQVGLTSPFGNIFSRVTLGALEPAAWHQLVHDGFAASEADMQFIDDLAGGLPFYTQMAAALLWQHGDHARARAEFVKQARPHFDNLWQNLHDNERRALRHAAGVSGVPAPAAALRERLHDDGLLRADGRLFSSAFADVVRGH
jgi:hypothetical protein